MNAERSPAGDTTAKRRRDRLRTELLACLGGPWPPAGDLYPRVHAVEQRDGYRLERISYASEPADRVPAILLVPDGATARRPTPGIAVWHQHNGQWHVGKAEPAGLAGDPMHHTGVALARLGYVVLCPDALGFGDRQDPTGILRNGDFERSEFLRYVVAGRSMAWKNILDMRRAVDYLTSRAEVDPNRLGCYGHSMGAIHTWLVGPFEPRLTCLVANCALPTYAAIHRHRLLHCYPTFVPGWQRHGDTPDIAGLIAPRRLHLNLGEADHSSPIDEVRAGIATISAEYQAARAADRFTHYVEPGAGHVLSQRMWELTRDTFRDHLG